MQNRIVEVRQYRTTVARGEYRNGIRAPKINGKCHAAWHVFDSLTEVYVDAEGAERVDLLGGANCVAVGVAQGLNKNNLRIEYPRWKQWNSF